MNGPPGVMALLLAVTMAGGIALLFCVPLWGQVKPGFFKLVGSIVVALALCTVGSMIAGGARDSQGGRNALWLVGLATVLTVVWLILLMARRSGAAHVVGFATVPISAALLAVLATLGEASYAVSLYQLGASALFLGAVLDGLLLGHWYLTDRGLSRGPINRFSTILLVSVGLQGLAVIVGGFAPTADSSSFNPLLTSAGLAAWIALGMVVATGMIAVLIRMTLKGTRATAVQSATGFFYLAVLTAFTAVLAMLVRFLPA